MHASTYHIVIVGGGFAGVTLAQSLAKNKKFEITLVDKNNYNFFPPLIYQVSTGFLEPSNISYPFRKLFQDKSNLHFRLGEIFSIHPDENYILSGTDRISYDLLIIATGTVTNFFGMDSIQQKAIPMKTIDDALNLRNSILLRFEQAAITTNAALRKKLLTIVIAGAGPTGVEVSGMLSEMKKKIFKKDYPEFDPAEIEIYLVDGANAVLSAMSVSSQQDTLQSLERMGIHVMLNAQVKSYENGIVALSNGTNITADTLVWAAGVTGSMIAGLPAQSIGRGNRLLVDDCNQVAGTKNIYAIGDICLQTTDAAFPNGHPQVAQVALQQAKLLSKNLTNIIDGNVRKPFAYKDKGSMAIIGFNKAVADIGKLHFKGFVAWFVWIFIHLMSLIGYRNRAKTAYNWFWAYLTKDQPLRLIIRPAKNLKK